MKAMPIALVVLPLTLTAAAALAGPADEAILGCRAKTDTAARLACYDAIQVNTRPAAVSAAAAVAPAAAPARGAEQSFGMEAVRQQEEAPKSIDSTVAGDFDGWGPNSRIRLANGQVWRIVDGSEAVLPRMKNPKVTIERNVFGTLFLKVEGSNNSAKVKRVQ